MKRLKLIEAQSIHLFVKIKLRSIPLTNLPRCKTKFDDCFASCLNTFETELTIANLCSRYNDAL